jgi:hypothetical protein
LGCRCCCHVTQTTGVRQSVRSGEKFLSDPWLDIPTAPKQLATRCINCWLAS